MACAMSPGGVQRQKPPVSPLRAAVPSPDARVNYRIVAVSDHPEMAPAVAKWLLDAFRHDLSPSHDELTAQLLAQKAPSEETFILLADGVPVGTASLVKNDLPFPSRSDALACKRPREAAVPWQGLQHAAGQACGGGGYCGGG
jgi:hypothetical protein